MSALSAIVFVGVTGLHAKTPKQLFIHFAFFPPPSLIIAPPRSCKLCTVSLFISFFSSFFHHNLSRVFEARGGFCRAFRRANARTEFKKQAIHTARESVFVLRKKTRRKGEGGGRRGRLCTQLKRHPTEKKKIFSTF